MICILMSHLHRSEMEESYNTKLHSLHQLVEENWSSLFNVRKGRCLILRTLPLIDKDSAKHLLQRMLSSTNLLIKKELADPVMSNMHPIG